MLLNNSKPLLGLEDISIIPQTKTSIKSRSECYPYAIDLEKTGEYRLPIVVAPMSCVLSEDNWEQFVRNNVNVVIPRTVSLEKRLELSKVVMTAFQLDEAEMIASGMPKEKGRKWNILIDIANGHMEAEINIGKQLREKFGDHLTLMGGNIARPDTYLEYCDTFDYVRIGIGGGNGCLTSTQTGVHYPMASLISDMNDIRVNNVQYEGMKRRCKIIADGGISSYRDVTKCLALGADYVMMGRVFAQAALEGENIGDPVEYYGMSTKKAQKEMGNKDHLKTSEGKFLDLAKEYTLPGWIENMESYLRSAMSYTDSRTLSEFRDNAECAWISDSSSRKINNK